MQTLVWISIRDHRNLRCFHSHIFPVFDTNANRWLLEEVLDPVHCWLSVPSTVLGTSRHSSYLLTKLMASEGSVLLYQQPTEAMASGLEAAWWTLPLAEAHGCPNQQYNPKAQSSALIGYCVFTLVWKEICCGFGRTTIAPNSSHLMDISSLLN